MLNAARALPRALRLLRRLESEDRHTRAIAQAKAAGITGLRDVWTMSA